MIDSILHTSTDIQVLGWQLLYTAWGLSRDWSCNVFGECNEMKRNCQFGVQHPAINIVTDLLCRNRRFRFLYLKLLVGLLCWLNSPDDHGYAVYSVFSFLLLAFNKHSQPTEATKWRMLVMAQILNNRQQNWFEILPRIHSTWGCVFGEAGVLMNLLN